VLLHFFYVPHLPFFVRLEIALVLQFVFFHPLGFFGFSFVLLVVSLDRFVVSHLPAYEDQLVVFVLLDVFFVLHPAFSVLPDDAALLAFSVLQFFLFFLR